VVAIGTITTALDHRAPFRFAVANGSPAHDIMCMNDMRKDRALTIAFVVAILSASGVLASFATAANAHTETLRIKPYVTLPAKRRPPTPDFNLQKIERPYTRRMPGFVEPPRGTCGAPPCAGGFIRLSPRDNRNFGPHDSRSRAQRQYYPGPNAR
jgi:hypothetical protein